MKSKVDVLCLDRPNQERDQHISYATCLYLNSFYKRNVVRANIFLGHFYLWWYRPKLLLISNFVGTMYGYNLVKMAHRMGIKTISFMAEGSVTEKRVHIFMWGYTGEKNFCLDALLVWSEQSRQILGKYYPEYQEKMLTTGATAFDRYKHTNFMNTETFTKTVGKPQYKKVIGLAGWGFQRAFMLDIPELREFKQTIGDAQAQMYQDDYYKIQNIYLKLAEAYPDYLFVCKQHPSTDTSQYCEFKPLYDKPNVVVIGGNRNDVSLGDCINASFVWIGYDTTTCMEAWLLDRPTFLINPTRSDFERSPIHRGSPIIKTYEEAKQFIDECLATGHIQAFDAIRDRRNEVITGIMMYADGKSYQRSAQAIDQVLKQPERQVNWALFNYYRMFKELVKYFFIRYFGLLKSQRARVLPARDFKLDEIYLKAVREY